MASFPWFRMYAEARTDAKLESLPDDQFRVWFRLLCLASDTKERGTLPEADYILAVNCAKGDEELLARTIASLVKLKIIAQDDDVLFFQAFATRQYDKPSDAPEATAERKRRERARAAATVTPTNGDIRPVTTDVTPMSRAVTRGHDPDTDRELDTDTEDNGLSSESHAREQPDPPARPKRSEQLPDGFELSDKRFEYAASKGMDAARINTTFEKFTTYWQRTGKPMKDWDAGWRNWVLNELDRAPALANGRASPVSTANDFRELADRLGAQSP